MSEKFTQAATIDEAVKKYFKAGTYLLSNGSHSKQIFENEGGDKLIRHYIKKPADMTIYKLLCSISNPFVRRIYDIGEDEEGYVVYEEYCDGMTLTEVCENGENSTLSDSRALDIVSCICRGLVALHESGIVHRDIKPDNIIISNDNSVKIIDFNISKIFKPGSSTDTHILGTIGFAPPEQFGFQQSEPRSDLYSLCVVLNFLLTGQHPSVKLCENKRIRKVITKCLSINPEQRYENARALYRALQRTRGLRS